MDERTRLFWLFLAGGLAIGGIAMAVPHTFQADTVISAGEMNANFANIEARLATLEAMGTDMPAGTIVAFGGKKENIPEGWELCDGRALNRTEPRYSALFDAIGTFHGGDGAPTFHLPDYRGLFLRGVDDGRGTDPDANARTAPRIGASIGDRVGSVQPFATARPRTPFATNVAGEHTHTVRVSGTTNAAASNARTEVGNNERTTSPAGAHSHIVTVGGDLETRPVNAYVHYLIKL